MPQYVAIFPLQHDSEVSWHDCGASANNSVLTSRSLQKCLLTLKPVVTVIMTAERIIFDIFSSKVTGN